MDLDDDVEFTAPSFKVVMIGDSAAGKTCISTSYQQGYACPYGGDPTIGACFLSRVEMVEGGAVKLCLWDTAGSEQFRSLSPIYYRDARAAALVFDLTNRKSFESLKSYWLVELMLYIAPSNVIVLMGNKCDLIDDEGMEEAVSQEEIDAFAEENNLKYFRTSAKNFVNVREAFLHMANNAHRILADTQTTRNTASLGGASGGGADDGACGC